MEEFKITSVLLERPFRKSDRKIILEIFPEFRMRLMAYVKEIG